MGGVHNGQTAVTPLHNSKKIVPPQPPTPIKTDNSAAECIVTATFRQKISKAMDIIFYLMKDRVKKIIYLCNGNQEAKI